MFLRRKKDDEAVFDDFEEETEEEQETKDPGAKFIIVPIILEFVLGTFVYLQSPQAALTYLYWLVPLLLVTALAGTYAYNRDADMKLFAAIACLASIGIALQLVIDQVFTPFSVFNPLKYMIGFVIAVVFIVFYEWFRKLLNQSFCVYLMIAVSAAVYLLLLLYGKDVNGNGTVAWMSVGPYYVQLTDFSKISAVMFYASLFASEEGRSETRVLLISTVFFLINLAGSLMIHELGSFFILYFLHLAILFIFMPKGTKKRIYLLTVAGITVAALGTAYVLYKYLYPLYAAGTLSGFRAAIWPYVQKVYLRFSVTANIYSDPYGAGYQLLQGKKALWMAGFFGNTVNFNAIPVPESDMAFIALINGFGLIMGFVCIWFFLRIFLSGSELSIRIHRYSPADAVVVYGVTVLLFAQAMLVILGSCNIIPLAGLPIPFLSRGGTYQTIVFCFSGLLLHMSEYGGELLRGDTDDE